MCSMKTHLQVHNVTNSSAGTCSQVSDYSGEVCRDELMSLQMCFSGVTSPLIIPSSIDQQTRESDAMSLVNGLPFLNPSQQCIEDIVPFLCLSIFNLCDSSNTLHTILRQDCLDIRDDVCAREWSQAVALLGAGALPVCENLPDITEDCKGIARSACQGFKFFAWEGDCVRRLIVCEACKVFYVPYAHQSPMHEKKKARVLLLARAIIIDTQTLSQNFGGGGGGTFTPKPHNR